MLLAETVFGLLGIALFAAMIYYTVSTLENIWRHEELSLTKFFIKPGAINSLKVLVISALIFSLGMVLAAVAMLMDIPLLSDVSKFSSIILFSGTVYFFYNLSKITESKE